MQIFGIILKAFLEHLSGKFEPKPETFVKFDMFDTIFNPFWTQNVEHSTKSGVRAKRREAARRGRGAKFDECFRKSASKGARAEAPKAIFYSGNHTTNRMAGAMRRPPPLPGV